MSAAILFCLATLAQAPADRVDVLSGTVTEQATGRPVVGATVHVRAFYPSGGPASKIKRTTTDRNGRYRFEYPPRGMTWTLAVLVAVEHRPPIFAFAPPPDPTIDPADVKPARLDVAVGARGSGASLAVKVVRNGRGVPGADVNLATVATRDLRLGGDLALRGSAMWRIAAPQAVTGGDGVARFHDLPPGSYEATVYPAIDPKTPWRHGTISERRTGVGIDLPPGGEVETTIAVPSGPAPTRFRILSPDGAPLANRSLEFGFGLGRVSSDKRFETDERGEGEYDFAPGLWTVDFRYRQDDPNPKSSVFPLRGEPFDGGRALVAVSPALARAGPIVLRAARHEPGSIKARLLGPDGAPTRGGAELMNPYYPDRAWREGTTDADGWIRFANVQSGKWCLRADVDGAAVPTPRFGPLRLSDEELTGRSMVRDLETTVESGAETVVELRAEPAGYVRIAIHAAAGRAPADYRASADVADVRPRGLAPYESSEDGAAYLFGPFPAGRRSIVVQEKSPAPGAARGRIEREVIVDPGRVVRLQVDAPPSPGRSPVGDWWRTSRPGESRYIAATAGLAEMAITLVLPDGTTPALGAQAAFIPAGFREPLAVGTADAAGRLSWTGNPAHEIGQPSNAAPALAATVAAWGPGVAGPAAATVKPGEPLRLTLPASTALSGRVTLGGEPAAGRDARIRVVLAPEGDSAVDLAMRRETTADAEGRFRFGGIAPGRHVVQAARDEIWTSRPVALTVEAGKDATVELDIPAPGATIALELVDRQGAPIAARFSVKDRGGPLAGLATIAGRTDARGAAVVGGLAAGVFELIVADDPEPPPLDVPPASPGAGPLGVRVQVSRRGP